MAALPAGGLNSTTLEDTLLEVTQLLQIAEQAATPPQTRVGLSINTDTNIASISAVLPIAATISPAGSLVFAATEYA